MPKPASKVTQMEQPEANHSYTDLWTEIRIIRDNHLEHLKQDVDEVKADLKETRKETNAKLDKLDNRIWMLVILVASTMLGVIIKTLFGA